MEISFTKAIESSLKAKEKGVEVALKSIYWLANCTEGISTHKYSSLLSFLEILDCPDVQELHCGANATYRTDVIANELQDSIAQVIREDIDKETEQSSCISILADESTDISVTQMLVVYMRLISSTDVQTSYSFPDQCSCIGWQGSNCNRGYSKSTERKENTHQHGYWFWK